MVSMEHLAGRGIMGELSQALVLAVAVSQVPHKGKPDVLEMYANLVRSTGVQNGFNECG